MRALEDHPLQWVTAAPLWEDVLGPPAQDPDRARGERMRAPAILRFASDAFMDDLGALLATEPGRLADHVAEPVSFRPLPPGRAAGERARLEVLKLFQPAHGDFYLVGASLTCRRPGLPDHEVHPERRERVAFVLRRVAAAGGEEAWVPGAAGRAGEWRAVAPGTERAVGEQEELLPLFGIPYAAEPDRRRRLFVGLVPTASVSAARNAAPAAAPGTAGGDAAAGAPPADAPADWNAEGQPDPRIAALDAKVIRPLRSLEAPVVAPQHEPTAERRDRAREQIVAAKRQAARFLLVDLGEFLRANHPGAWEGVRRLSRPDGAGRQLYDDLAGTEVAPGTSWVRALRDAWEQQDVIFGERAGTPSLDLDLTGAPPGATVLRSWLVAGLGAPPPPDPEQVAAQAASGEPRRDLGAGSGFVPKAGAERARYRVRCVYQRPECGPLHDDVVSAATEDFEIASFFDFDAPARPLHIGLPVDVSLRDIRKFKRNVTVALSDELRRQVSRVSDLRDLMAGSAGAGQQFSVGVLCSFSIPIITICALILLLIMVQLLNIVFRWLPYFQICFPVGPKAKP